MMMTLAKDPRSEALRQLSRIARYDEIEKKLEEMDRVGHVNRVGLRQDMEVGKIIRVAHLQFQNAKVEADFGSWLFSRGVSLEEWREATKCER